MVTQIVSLKHANPDDMKKVLDPLISRTSIILSYPPTGMLIITDVLSNVKRLLTIISALDVSGVGEQISVIPLKHAVATEMVTSLNAIFQPTRRPAGPGPSRMKIIPDERTNASSSGLASRSSPPGSRVRETPRPGCSPGRIQDAGLPPAVRQRGGLGQDPDEPAVEGSEAADPLPASPTPVTPRTRGKIALLSSDVQIVSDKATNTLIITANKEDCRILEEVIRKVDVPGAMVYIEALIMEVDVNKNFQVGVEWRFVNDLGTLSGFDTGRAAAFGGSGGGGIGGSYQLFPGTSTQPTFPGGFSLGVLGAGITIGGVTFPNIGAVINAVQQDSSVHILSNPQLLTSDNEEATISVGKNIPYITRAERSRRTWTTRPTNTATWASS